MAKETEKMLTVHAYVDGYEVEMMLQFVDMEDFQTRLQAIKDLGFLPERVVVEKRSDAEYGFRIGHIASLEVPRKDGKKGNLAHLVVFKEDGSEYEEQWHLPYFGSKDFIRKGARVKLIKENGFWKMTENVEGILAEAKKDIPF
jgi:hypothetical protein